MIENIEFNLSKFIAKLSSVFQNYRSNGLVLTV